MKKIVITALLALTATTVAAGTAQANPVAATESLPVFHGSDHGTGFIAQLSPDHHDITATIDKGQFTLAAAHDVLSVTDDKGTVFATVPLEFEVAGRHIALEPVIEQQGRALTLRPTGVAPGELHDVAAEYISNQERWDAETQRASFGALIGGAIGFLIGGMIFGVLLFPFWLATIGIGAGIGFLATGGQPLIDAGIAYFTGQPEPQPAP